MTQLDRARQHVLRLIQSREYEPDGRLPSLSSLAGDAGVARMTMYKALRQLQRESLVRLEHGRGIYAAHGARESRDAGHRQQSAFERTTARLESDILAHAYAPGSALPTRKELCRRYGCGARTLNRALQQLCQQDLLVHWGRRYRVSQSRVRSEYATVIAVMRSPETGSNELLLTSPRARERYQTLESTCELYGLRLAIAPFNYSYRGSLENGQFRALLESLLRSQLAVVGFAVFSEGIGNETVVRLLSLLAQYRLPVAMLDETGSLPYPLRSFPHTPITCFTTAQTRRAGQHMARYLYEQGHRRVAYIDAYQQIRWTRNRLMGLRDVFEGLGGAVRCFGSGLSLDALDGFRKEILDPVARARRYGHVHETIGGLLQRIFDEGTFIVDGCYISHHFAEVFAEALADRTLTAWVCCNDTLGLEVLRFFKSRRVRVPSDISVVGFDNSDRALLAGLTSYSFSSPTAMRKVLQSVIAPNAACARESLVSPVELDGVVKPRSSSSVRRSAVDTERPSR